MISIPVELGERSYAITIDRGAAERLAELAPRRRGGKVVLVASRKVWSLFRKPLARPLAALEAGAPVLVPDGERYKSASTLDRLYEGFLARGLGRDGLVVAVGGGVVGDLAGFAAATFMRGVDWAVVPTTLLSMVDSSIGGKVGLNHSRAKNLVGAFHQPRAVVVDPRFLDTLPVRERQSGAYEVLKAGILGDAALFGAMEGAPERLSGWDPTALDGAIAAACRVKAAVVGGDEREGGARKILNLGHTLGHALESVTRYRRFTHGEAVGWGTLAASIIAHGRGLLDAASFGRIANALDRLGPRPRVSDLPPGPILDALAHDKKNRAGRTVFILPTAVGRVEIRDDVTPEEVRGALRALREREASPRPGRSSGASARPSARAGGSRPRR
jgi:3-dehydroquinate synthase